MRPLIAIYPISTLGQRLWRLGDFANHLKPVGVLASTTPVGNCSSTGSAMDWMVTSRMRRPLKSRSSTSSIVLPASKLLGFNSATTMRLLCKPTSCSGCQRQWIRARTSTLTPAQFLPWATWKQLLSTIVRHMTVHFFVNGDMGLVRQLHPRQIFITTAEGPFVPQISLGPIAPDIYYHLLMAQRKRNAKSWKGPINPSGMTGKTSGVNMGRLRKSARCVQ